MEKRSTTTFTLFTLLITSLAIFGLVAPVTAPGEAAHTGSTIETSTYAQDEPRGGELSGHENESHSGYGPDFDIPSNDFIIFYSDTELPDDEEADDDEEFEYEAPGGGIRSIESIEGANNPDAAAAGASGDMAYYITPSLMEINGWTLTDYRENQVTAYEWSPDESLVLEPWQFETESDGVIDEAYVGIVGVTAGAEPRFDTGDDLDRLVGREGGVITYLDFELDHDELPDTNVDDPVTVDGGDRQVQERWTYHIEDHQTTRELSITGDLRNIPEIDEAHGATGAVLEYTDASNRYMTFHVNGEIEADIYEYHWERTRDRIYDSRTIRVSASDTTSGQGSTYETATVHHGPNSTGDSISADVSGTCTTHESTSATTNVDETWEELGGDRQIDIDEDVTIGVSGWISGSCSGTITGTAGSGNTTTIGGWIYGDVSGSVSGSDTVTIEYDYWDHWNSVQNTDEGGWVIQDTSLHRVDSVQVDDDMSAKNTDNNYLSVNQVSIEVSENRYHNVITLDHHAHNEGQTVSTSDINDMYLWSMMMFGDETWVESDWRSYSYTRYEDAGVLTTCTEYRGRSTTTEPCYEDEPFPNQLGVYLISQPSGPDIVSTGESSHHNPELQGWLGDPVDAEDYGVHENVGLGTGEPAIYHEFIVRNAPEPATSLISVHGTEREIHSSETEVIPYVEPDVSINYYEDTGAVIISVEGKDGEPLPGRDVLVTAHGADGQYTTNSFGNVILYPDDGIHHVQAEVMGDDIGSLVDGPDQEVYYGSVTAEKTIGFAGVVGHLYDVIMQILLAIPLVLLYLLWRDAQLGV